LTPKQAEIGGWPLHRVLPPNFGKSASANQRRSQFLVLDVEINLGGGAVLQNLGSVQLHVE
jgi:hypothetical protein